jgi:hypothetical protein
MDTDFWLGMLFLAITLYLGAAISHGVTLEEEGMDPAEAAVSGLLWPVQLLRWLLRGCRLYWKSIRGK